MRLPSPSETAAQAEASGGSSPSRWGNSKADAYGAATANGTASQQAPISLRRVASTITDINKKSYVTEYIIQQTYELSRMEGDKGRKVENESLL